MMKCERCGSTELQISRYRVRDLSQVLILRCPVRCQICYNRQFVGIVKALKIHRASKANCGETDR